MAGAAEAREAIRTGARCGDTSAQPVLLKDDLVLDEGDGAVRCESETRGIASCVRRQPEVTKTTST
jgi:hypothetical protein